MLNSNTLSTGNAPQLNQLDNDDIPCSKDVHRDDNISLTDNVAAFPITVSAMEETKQTTDLNEPLDGQDYSRLTPLSILTADTIRALCSQKLLKVLFDPGLKYTFINRRVLPRHCKPFQVKKAKKINTINGSNLCNEMVILCDIQLPEFDKSRRVNEQKAIVFDHNTRYDIILGTDFSAKTGIDIKYSTKSIQWFKNELPM